MKAANFNSKCRYRHQRNKLTGPFTAPFCPHRLYSFLHHWPQSQKHQTRSGRPVDPRPPRTRYQPLSSKWHRPSSVLITSHRVLFHDTSEVVHTVASGPCVFIDEFGFQLRDPSLTSQQVEASSKHGRQGCPNPTSPKKKPRGIFQAYVPMASMSASVISEMRGMALLSAAITWLQYQHEGSI